MLSDKNGLAGEAAGPKKGRCMMKRCKITRMALPIAAAAVVLLAWPAESPGRGQVTISIGGMTIRGGGDRGHKVADRRGKGKDRRGDQRSRGRDDYKRDHRQLQRVSGCGRVLSPMPFRGRHTRVLLRPGHGKHRVIVPNPRRRRQVRRVGRSWFRWLW